MSSLIHKFLSKIRSSLASEVHTRLAYDNLAASLRHETLTSQRPGTTPEPIADTEVIVSLTTHGRRIYEAYLAIESIMQGSILPNRIILWLSKEQENTPLPQTLKNQQKRGLEVRYVYDLGPYTKSVPAMLAYPEACIVTIDDDILYPYDALEMLVACHAQHPKAICANRILDVELDKDGNPTSLPTWHELTDKTRISKRNFFEGVGSVLYPPHSFNPEDLDTNLFLQHCPKADDVWMNVLALHNNIEVVPANHHYLRFPLVINENVQDKSLWQWNSTGSVCPNDTQLQASLQHFSISYS